MGPLKIVSDNASCFFGVEAREFQEKCGLQFTQTMPNEPRGNERIEKASGVLKFILTLVLFDAPGTNLPRTLYSTVIVYNRRISANGYSPCFLMFGP